ncbi:hypothetical protein BH09PSE6_BH09PSE6_31700 [soil metagenome]
MKLPLLSLATLAFAAGLSACASPTIAAENVMRQPRTLASVMIVDRTTGQTLPTYRQGNEYWVAGEPGHRYAIAVQSASSGRVMGVMSVDGINVISGQTAWRNELGAQTGYVFAPRERAEITGWRKSQREVAVFEFSSPSQSYAEQTGRGNDIGAIGVALFRERVVEVQPVESAPPISSVPAPPPRARNESSAADAAGAPAPASEPSRSFKPESRLSERAAAPAAAAPSLGTAHGERQSAWVDYTNFVRASTTPDQIIVIRYDRREVLVARGIIPSDKPRLPDPFPVAGSFVPDPPRQ